MAERDEKFASRWSRRKRDAQVTERADPAVPAEPQAVPAESGTPAVGQVAAQESAGNLPEPETVEVPDPDTLDADGDFTVFLKDNVPETIRRRALRRLWRLNPVFANLDGLNDYDDDFTDAATVVEGLKTIYQVGKGMVVEEDETEAAEKPEVALQSDGESEGEGAAETGAEDPDETPEQARRLASLPSDEIGTESQGPGSHAEPAAGAEKTGQESNRKTESGIGNHRRGALARRWGKPGG